jgi:ABC-2 type transport system permease protein
MKDFLRAEMLKLRTARSTYGASLIAIIFTFIGSFFIDGREAAKQAIAPDQLARTPINAIPLIAQIVAIIGVLLVTNEYRYNTIYYTLSAAKSRTKALLAKVLVFSAFNVVFSLFIILFSVGVAYIGLKTKNAFVPSQVYDAGSIITRVVFYSLAISLFGMLFAILSRNITFAIVLLFIVPTTVEALLRLLLHDSAKYLPFNALFNVLSPVSDLSTGISMALVTGYLVFGWIIAWRLFLRRDAN